MMRAWQQQLPSHCPAQTLQIPLAQLNPKLVISLLIDQYFIDDLKCSTLKLIFTFLIILKNTISTKTKFKGNSLQARIKAETWVYNTQYCSMLFGRMSEYNISSSMSQFLKENVYSPKHMTENRVLMLAEKINCLKIGHRAEAERKIDSLEKQVGDLESDFEKMIVSFNDRHYELKHIFSKIGKQISFDHLETDRSLQEQCQRCEEMALEMISKHVDERKASDARITRFVDEKCGVIRDLIEKENKERSLVIREIQESLDRDLADIREKLQSDCSEREERIESIHGEFLEEYEKMHAQFSQLSEKCSDSEAQFYKMLRDVLKKVKKEVGEGRKEREEMEESILVLIERICDKAMETQKQ